MPIYYHSIFLLFLFFQLTSSAKCHIDDENGLLAFKSGITADPSGMLSSWEPGTDCCNGWFGIRCGPNLRVSVLSLFNLFGPNASLIGTISPSISKLRFLEEIYLVDLDNLSGTLPDLLFHLPKLDYIYIRNTNLSGPLPDKFGPLTRLTSLGLIGNRFSGSIPSSISKQTNLTRLELRDNLLTGPIPDGFRQLRELTNLLLSGNQLSGNIPDFFSLSSFPNLEILDLSSNKFTGQIPASISALAPVLRFLELGHNSLTGEIPSFLGNFEKLYSLNLSSNRFTGVVPISFGNLSSIGELDLSRNFLVDPFPIMNLQYGILSLDLSYNSFHLGKIPKWVTLSPLKQSVKLAKCGIKTELDNWRPKGNDAFSYIDLSDNEISGSPVELLSRINGLVSFKASNNQLKFDLESLKINKTLEELDLGRNQIFGKVSTAVLGVIKLNLSYNKLMGSIPPNKFPVATFVGNGGLCDAPLPPCCPRCH